MPCSVMITWASCSVWSTCDTLGTMQLIVPCLAVLGVVNEHLCTCFANLFPKGLQSGELSAEGSELATRYHLTPREAELTAKVSLGVARRDLAGELFISENTVKRHLNSVYAKCGVRSYEELARLVGSTGRVVVVEKLVSGLGVPH